MKVKCINKGASVYLEVGKVYNATVSLRYDADGNYYTLEEIPGKGPYQKSMFQIVEEDVPPTQRSPEAAKLSEDEANKKALMVFFATPSDPNNCICGCPRQKCLYHR